MPKGARSDEELVPGPRRQGVTAIAPPPDRKAVVGGRAGQQFRKWFGDADAGHDGKLRQRDAMCAQKQRRPCTGGKDDARAAHRPRLGLYS